MVVVETPIPLVERAGRAGFILTCGGRAVFFSPVVPDDAPRIRQGMGELSATSRYHRFFSAINELTSDQLHYLSHPDQRSHVAFAALDPETPDLRGLGLGRFVGTDDRPDAAEFAVAVIDACHRLGIGTALVAILCAAAIDRGVRSLDSLILPDNHAVLQWFRGLGAQVETREDFHLARIDPQQLLLTGPAKLRDLIRAVAPAVTRVAPPRQTP